MSLEMPPASPRLRVASLAAVLTAATATACSPAYVLRAGWEEARILADRRPIAEAVHDTTVPGPVRAKLRLVEDGRYFADHALGLDPGDSFRSYAEVPSDTLLLVVTAAEELALRWKTWWFPIVGRVPYRGYFDFRRARAEAERLEAEGYDVSLGPTSAFSTLGWLPDPVLSTTLGRDSVGLVETVIHEITHTTFFPAGQARFNESFATFAGHRGAVAFFCGALAEPEGCELARNRWEDTRIFGRFFQSVARELSELYESDLPPESKRRRKREVFRAAAERYREEVRPRLRAGRYGTLDPERLDNAWVLSRLLYYTRLDDFEAVYRQRGADLRATLGAIIQEARRGDPWEALDRLLESAADPAHPNRRGSMYERILVAIDFSEPSVEAFRWAARRFPEAEITLFHALESRREPAYVRRALGAELDLGRERELDVRTNLEHLIDEAGVPARISVRTGWPPAETERAAVETDSQLVVVGAHTRRIWPSDEPGATASKIVEESSRPVLVWRPRPRQADPEDRTVLAALDLREGSEGLGPVAAEVAAYFEARLVLLHVLPRTLQAYMRAVSTARKAQETLKQVGDAARQALTDQVPARRREELEVQTVVVRGRPVTQILALAENEAANLIVMGQRHLPSRTGRALLGSVTGSVLRGANCSILVLTL